VERKLSSIHTLGENEDKVEGGKEGKE